jgi:hypothetical protein
MPSEVGALVDGHCELVTVVRHERDDWTRVQSSGPRGEMWLKPAQARELIRLIRLAAFGEEGGDDG